jgi:hypothetical protein
MSGGGRRREEGGWALSTKVFLAYLDQEGGGEVEGDEKRNRDTVGKCMAVARQHFSMQ